MIRRTRNAAGRRPLKPALHLQGGGASTPNPESFLPETSPQRDLQTVEGAAVRRESAGRPVPRPRRALVPGVDEKSQVQALDRTQPLLASRTGGTADPRLQAQRCDLAVRGPRRRCRQGDRQALPPPPQRGIPQVPQLHRGQRPLRPRHPHRHGQLRDPQDGSRRFARRPRWHVHDTPTFASWPGRTLLRLVDGKATEARRPPIDRRP